MILPVWSSPQSVIRDLEGAWRLKRTIPFHATMEGTAEFTVLETNFLKYREEGKIRLVHGSLHEVYREYLFRGSEDGFVVLFPENVPRVFHEIILRQNGHYLSGRAEHLCGEDRYESQYRFFFDNSFAIIHTVIGPRKSYTSNAHYTRF